MNSPLAKMIPTTFEQEKAKRDGWQGMGILVVAVDDDRLHLYERDIIREIGNRIYGKGSK